MKNIIDFIGKTPLIKLDYLSKEYGVNLFAKCEFMNPSGSVKDRAAHGMIQAAIEQQLINDHTSILEPTSGNTGIALSFICSALNIPITLTMPESMSLERRQLLSALGANIVLTPAHLGMSGAVEKANQLQLHDSNVIIPQQFNNSANPNMHYQTTGPEILADVDVDVFVTGVGTGGTISGVTRYLKEHRCIHSVAVEPIDSAVISGNEPGPHMIQGIGAGFIPKNYNHAIIDEIFTISNKEAIEMTKLLAKKEGLFCGISAGANVHSALEVAKRPEFKNKNVVTILCDTGERYLSMNIFDEGVS